MGQVMEPYRLVLCEYVKFSDGIDSVQNEAHCEQFLNTYRHQVTYLLDSSWSL